jgi:recombination protein RecA
MKKVTLSDAEKEISKFFGNDSIFFDGNFTTTIDKENIISTGSPMLDYAIGVGGLPRGRIIQLAGQESSGKTMLSFSCIKSYLDKDPENTALFIDAEFTYDKEWVEKLGVDSSRVMVIRTNDAKKIFEGLVGIYNASGKGKKMKGILDHIIEGKDPRFKKLGIIVLDSIAVLNTPLEQRADIGKANMAPIPRFLSTELKKLTPVVAEANVAFIGINQVRVNLGQMFGDPSTSPGGKALKHACSLMVNMAPIFSSDSVISDSNGNRIGHKVRAKIGKNKVGSPFKKAEYSIEYLKGIVNKAEELLDLGNVLGLVNRPNNVMYEIMGESIRGRAAAISYLEDNDEIRTELDLKCREIYFDNKNTDETEEESAENDLMGMIE